MLPLVCIWQNCNRQKKLSCQPNIYRQNNPICNFSACASQQSATHAIPSQPDTLALVLSCSYSDPHVVYHRLVYTYKTKLHWALALAFQKHSCTPSNITLLRLYHKVHRVRIRQSIEHHIFLLLKIKIFHQLSQPLLQRARANELSSKCLIWPKPYSPSKTLLQEYMIQVLLFLIE